MRISVALHVAALLALAAAAPAASRFEEFTKKFEHAPDRAEVVTATLLGGQGTEWLAAGGFQPDGTIVAAGTALGPNLSLGIEAVVLGTDAPIQTPVRRPLLRNGRPERDKDGQPKLEPLAWNHPNATAFIVRLTADAAKITSVTRFGWKAAGLTGATVDRDGSVYVCGPAGNQVATISSDFDTIQGTTNVAARGTRAGVYLAKLSPDGSKAIWVRTITGPSVAPSVKLGANGNVQLQSSDIRTFDGSGKQIKVLPYPSTDEGILALNPKDGTMALGGEHHWPTGREPYRDPVLNIYKADGSLLYELYNWDGPFVGLNALRLVSDSAIRGVTYDGDGNLILHAWSDGGNSVFYHEPYDVFTVSKNMNGLGMSIWGAGVLSCAYVIKLDTSSFKVKAGTLWVGYLNDRNKPNSVTINAMETAADGSVCIGGSAAHGLIRTGNAFKDEPSGSYVAVMNKNLDSLRFCSTVPGAGETELGQTRQRWAIATGRVKDRPVAMFLSGAVQPGDTAPPTLNALQPKYGGGMSDGHLLLLDLSTSTSTTRQP